MTDRAISKISIAAFERLMAEKLPLAARMGMGVESLDAGRVVMRMTCDDEVLRPGGTVSGPAMVALADVALYAVVLSLIGPVELAVTTNLSINFLRRPPAGALFAEAEILKLGRRLAVGAVTLYSEDAATPVAHVTGTYSIPPRE